MLTLVHFMILYVVISTDRLNKLTTVELLNFLIPVNGHLLSTVFSGRLKRQLFLST